MSDVSGETDRPAIRRGDRVTPAEYRSLLAAVKWRPLEQGDLALAAALETSDRAEAEGRRIVKRDAEAIIRC